MDILGIHIATRLELDKTQAFEFPEFQPEQIDYWLNKSYNIYVEETAYPTTEGKIPYEVTQKRIDELREIVIPDYSIIPTLNSKGEYVSKLPNDYKHLTRHTCITEFEGKELIVSGIITNQDKFNLQYKDPFWTPIPEEPLYYIVGDNIVYNTKGKFKIKETFITYIKQTPNMRLGTHYSNPTTDVDCAISSEFVQHMIINNAVNMILENIESPRYQTNLNELNKTN